MDVTAPYTYKRMTGELRRAGYQSDQIRDILFGVSFPAEYELLAAHLQACGVTMSTLVSDLGGSP